MTVIVKRTKGAGIVFILGALVSLVYPLIEYQDASRVYSILMLPLTILFTVFAIIYYRTPVDLVLLEGSHTLHFPHGVVVDAGDIVDVTYHTSRRRRGLSLARGSITVQTKDRTIHLLFVSDCITAGKALTELMYKRRAELEENPFS